jgi:hypothetical protein
MKNLSIIIIGCTFLLSGSLGLAIENLSETILQTNAAIYSTSLLYYLFIIFIFLGIFLIIFGELKNNK